MASQLVAGVQIRRYWRFIRTPMPEEEESGDGDGTNDGEGGDVATVLPALMTMNAQFEVLSEIIPEISALPISLVATDAASVSICWRPDGTAVAVATVDSSDNVRRIRHLQQGRSCPCFDRKKRGWIWQDCAQPPLH